MAKIAESQLGKEWFAKAGFAEPAGVHIGLPMPAELPFLPIGTPPEPMGSVVPAGFPLQDLPLPPSLPLFQVPK